MTTSTNGTLLNYAGQLLSKPRFAVRFVGDGHAEHVMSMALRLHTGQRLELQQAIPQTALQSTKAWAQTLRPGAMVDVDIPRQALTLHARDVAHLRLSVPLEPHHYKGAQA